MATKRTDGQRPRMIHCEYCGEDYASSYKQCPFCDEADDGGYYDDEQASRLHGGKRLAGPPRANNSRGGGYGGSPSPLNILFTVISLALIIAAVIIVISIIKPLVDRGRTSLPEGSNPPASTQPTSNPTPSPAGTPAGTSAPGPDASGTPDGTVPPTPNGVTPPTAAPSAPPTAAPTPSAPASQAATGFTLNKSEFTLSDQWPAPITLQVTFTPAGTTGTITWTSSNPDIASVDSNGKVSHGTKTGTATITATMAGGVSQTCRVHNSVTGGSSGTAPSGGSGTAGTSLSLNRSDFTLVPGESFQVLVSGNSGTPAWSIGNTAVATVSGNGTVTYAGPGSTTLTCTVDGQTLTCIVRGKSG